VVRITGNVKVRCTRVGDCVIILYVHYGGGDTAQRTQTQERPDEEKETMAVFA